VKILWQTSQWLDARLIDATNRVVFRRRLAGLYLAAQKGTNCVSPGRPLKNSCDEKARFPLDKKSRALAAATPRLLAQRAP
jgi:hypothetical protein